MPYPGRAPLAVLFALSALASTVLLNPTTDASHVACYEAAEHVPPNSTRTGTAPSDGWVYYFHQAGGPVAYTATISPSSGARLQVFLPDCTRVCESWGSGTVSCSAPSGSGFLVELAFYDRTGGGDYTLAFSGQDPPACADFADNDGDGNSDFPEDSGCASADDGSELADCAPTVPTVTFCLGTGAPIVSQRIFRLDPTGGLEHAVMGYLDTYSFNIQGVIVNAPCLTLLVDEEEVNPCATANGRFLSRNFVLVEETFSGPRTVQPHLAEVGVCHAELVFLVGNVGVQAAPAFTPCVTS